MKISGKKTVKKAYLGSSKAIDIQWLKNVSLFWEKCLVVFSKITRRFFDNIPSVFL